MPLLKASQAVAFNPFTSDPMTFPEQMAGIPQQSDNGLPSLLPKPHLVHVISGPFMVLRGSGLGLASSR